MEAVQPKKKQTSRRSQASHKRSASPSREEVVLSAPPSPLASLEDLGLDFSDLTSPSTAEESPMDSGVSPGTVISSPARHPTVINELNELSSPHASPTCSPTHASSSSRSTHQSPTVTHHPHPSPVHVTSSITHQSPTTSASPLPTYSPPRTNTSPLSRDRPPRVEPFEDEAETTVELASGVRRPSAGRERDTREGERVISAGGGIGEEVSVFGERRTSASPLGLQSTVGERGTLLPLSWAMENLGIRDRKDSACSSSCEASSSLMSLESPSGSKSHSCQNVALCRGEHSDTAGSQTDVSLVSGVGYESNASSCTATAGFGEDGDDEEEENDGEEDLVEECPKPLFKSVACPEAGSATAAAVVPGEGPGAGRTATKTRVPLLNHKLWATTRSRSLSEVRADVARPEVLVVENTSYIVKTNVQPRLRKVPNLEANLEKQQLELQQEQQEDSRESLSSGEGAVTAGRQAFAKRHVGRLRRQMSAECAAPSEWSVGEKPRDASALYSVAALPRTKVKLVKEGSVQVCQVRHRSSLVVKILSSRLLRRWETQYVHLDDDGLFSDTPGGTQECLVPYSRMEDVHVVVPWGTSGHKYCVRIVVRDGSILLQASNSYIRDQWLHSILWKKNVYKYRNLLRAATRPDVVLKELKTLVELSLATPLHDHSVCQVPLELASSILTQGENRLSRQMSEEIIVTLAPLLENNQPSQEICNFFSRHCTDNPRSCLVLDMFTPVVTRILKHNVDFGKYPHVRRFVQDYIQALNTQNDGLRVVQQFIHNMHGPTSSCPHLRVLPNVVAVCTAAVCNLTELHKSSERLNNTNIDELSQHLNCYLSILAVICEYEDWRPGLAQLLQPIPFPDQALADENFIRQITAVVERIGTDPRCDVHQMVLGTREDKEGWLQILCPSSLACVDEGTAWANMLEVLINCCCKRKKFLRLLSKSLGACMLLALRGNTTAQDVLCLMLEWKQVDGADQSLQVVTTLQSTPTGKKRYQALCERQMHLRELQQKGGPRKLTLPSCSTDTDVIRLLSSGSFGNLEFLCLAFTRVTSACAEQLIKLPTLRYLNLWATQFGDVGLQLISEHLHKLQVLNLCETPVTDKGLGSLSSLKNLRKLNLNSTSLSAQTFEELKECLPALHECDVRYTDAW
ncbi:C-Maf-inducing protein-like isoform X1 [Oratosquilla oratoria]|uniref:C-Maf-inducing protein-like isoform X1 n=1 Tax=Oratosquilla oratoria TaxID=337810 RepID=UPI003F7636DC